MFGVDKIIKDTTASAIEVARDFLNETDFKAFADKVINKLEAFFKEDSIPDKVVEQVMSALRKRYDIEDSNPDN